MQFENSLAVTLELCPQHPIVPCQVGCKWCSVIFGKISAMRSVERRRPLNRRSSVLRKAKNKVTAQLQRYPAAAEENTVDSEGTRL